MTTADLIREVQNNCRSAEKIIFQQYAGKMLALCRRYVKSEEDAEEMMGNGFLKLFKAVSTFTYDNDAAFYSWMKRIMINECLMFLRKQQAFKTVSETEAENCTLDEDLLDRLSTKEIFELILQLPVGYRTVFNLFVIEGMSHADIATNLGISIGTSKSQLNKAKLLLQKKLLSTDAYYAKQQQR